MWTNLDHTPNIHLTRSTPQVHTPNIRIARSPPQVHTNNRKKVNNETQWGEREENRERREEVCDWRKRQDREERMERRVSETKSYKGKIVNMGWRRIERNGKKEGE